MRITKSLLGGVCIAILGACSSSGKSDVRRATFEPDPRVAASEQVYLDSQDENGETVTVAVRVRELADIAEADVVLDYDPARLVYFAWGPGELLEQGPVPASYQVSEVIPGRLRMRVSRSSGTAAAGADDPVMVVLRFKVVAIGSAPAEFDVGSAMYDDQSIAHAGVTFFAGVFSGM